MLSTDTLYYFIFIAQCYHRKLAWLTEKGLVFKAPAFGDYRRVTVPCGKCIACRVNRAAEWSIRCLHESQYVNTGCFITLTYSPENCPSDYCLVKSDLQKFIKRLRSHIDYHKKGSIRAYMAVGEYGTKRGRPHYHVVIIGWSPDDLKLHSTSYSGMPIYTSATLESIWRLGFCPVGTLSQGSAAYVARYTKKDETDNVGNRPKPFTLASRNIPLSNGSQGAIGAQWVLDNHKVLRLGYINHPTKVGVKCRIPDYYFDLLERFFPDEYELLKEKRYDYALDVQDGALCVDINGKPTAYFEKPLTDVERIEFAHKLSLDTPLTDADILDTLTANMRAEEFAQRLRLSTLKRCVD